VVLCCAGLLAACGILPKPFAHQGSAVGNPLLALAGGGAIRVEIDPSLPESLSKPLKENMIKSLWAENVPASAAVNFRPRYILKGQLKIFYPSVFDPEEIEIIWTLADSKGNKLDAFDQRLSGDRAGWLFLDKDLLADLSVDTGKEVVRLLYAQQRLARGELKLPPSVNENAQQSGSKSALVASQSVGDSANLSKKPKIFLAEIIGAPGDGKNSLYRNLRRFLDIAGAELVSERPNSTILVKGFVNVSPPFNGANDVAITWLVATKEGKELGKVTQNNKVPVGTLSGRWGDAAHVIAQGASIGIIDIVEQNLSPRKGKPRLIVPPG